MYQLFLSLVERGLAKRVPATGLGAFRIVFGLVAVQEILFLFYFRHLIFDPVPYLDRASPILHFFLLLWLATAVCLTVGYKTRRAAVANYLLWVVFVVFTPMWQDFDGGFDQLMTGTSFLLIFLPSERALSLDTLRRKLRSSVPVARRQHPDEVPVLAYWFPLAFSLGLVYFDSGLHKLSSEFWRNGMGAWLPSTMPYYVSPLDMSWLLNIRSLEAAIGYTVVGFQLVFVFVFWFRRFRIPLLLMGAAFHTGIILSLNVYPFGFGMLAHYPLLVPFRWWRSLGALLQRRTEALTVFYDEACPLCNRTVIAVEHFDVFGAVTFKGLQTDARKFPQLATVPEDRLLTDLYALDHRGKLTAGLDTYIRILAAMAYTALLASWLRLPGIYQIASRTYRRIADGRERLVCGLICEASPLAELDDEHPLAGWYERYAATDRQIVQRIAKFAMLALALQFNSTVHYGILYRWSGAAQSDPALAMLDKLSDSVINYSHAFLGISPHALYMHDHFAGYNRILALTYRDSAGQERWLPFVNREGRLLTPNWGRIQSMWANVAVTSQMSRDRLEKFVKKVTAYYGVQLGLDLSSTDFLIKMKRVETPMDWVYELRHQNMSGAWAEVGVAQWRPDGMRLNVTGLNLASEALSGSRAREDRAPAVAPLAQPVAPP